MKKAVLVLCVGFIITALPTLAYGGSSSVLTEVAQYLQEPRAVVTVQIIPTPDDAGALHDEQGHAPTIALFMPVGFTPKHIADCLMYFDKVPLKQFTVRSKKGPGMTFINCTLDVVIEHENTARKVVKKK